jgi:hypothetical protein
MKIDWRKKYDNIALFYELKARVRLNGKFGFVDLQGNEVVPLKYDWVDSFNNGRAAIRIGDYWGEVDLNGKEYFSPEVRAKLRKDKIQRLLKDL